MCAKPTQLAMSENCSRSVAAWSLVHTKAKRSWRSACASTTSRPKLKRSGTCQRKAAFALCRDQKLPIKVFSIFKNGALKRVVMGEDEGTLVYA